MGRKGDGGEGKERRNYSKRKGGEAKRESISVTPVSPMLVGLPVRVNKIKYSRLAQKFIIADRDRFLKPIGYLNWAGREDREHITAKILSLAFV